MGIPEILLLWYGHSSIVAPRFIVIHYSLVYFVVIFINILLLLFVDFLIVCERVSTFGAKCVVRFLRYLNKFFSVLIGPFDRNYS